MNNTGFIVFSDDWGEHPSSCQHIFRHIPESYTVLWVNTIGMRNPTLTIGDVKKIISKSKRMVSSLLNKNEKQHFHPNFNVFQPLQLPFSNIPLIRWINQKLVNASLKKKLKALKLQAPIVVTTAPNACDYIETLGGQKVVYYCVDDFSEWPGFEKDLVRSMEDKLIEQADIFIATSNELLRNLVARGKEVHLLTHGVDCDLFTSDVESESPLLREIPKPRVGYFGLFDERSDQNLIRKVAENMPDISFVITGDVVVDISKLKTVKNIFFTGSVPYSELPNMAFGWEMCMLPYKINKLTDAIQPLKLKEYLATGKPVISTPIKEARIMTPYIVVGESSADWEKAIRDHLNSELPKFKEELNNFLQSESWSNKAREFLKISTG